MFTLILFSTDPAFIGQAVAAGVEAIIVDWENIDKDRRQASSDTQINYDTLEDLARVRACTDALVICRLNQFETTTETEIEQAIEAGADEIMLPMVRTTEEVKSALELVRGRCGVGILVETVAAVQAAAELARLPLSRVYIGLNDLAIERKTPNIFTPLIDGTLENIRRHFDQPFGFGGLTLPEFGNPIPCQLLISEMARLRCDFSFLRRSFYADIKNRNLSIEIPRILAALEAALRRPSHIVNKDRRELESTVSSWNGYSKSQV